MIITLSDALASGRGTERPFNCISPDHEDRNASASVNVVKGVWFCYSCGAHGTVGDHVPTVEDAVAILAGTKPARIYPEAWLDMFDADHVSKYWVSRVGIEVASANRCGTDPSGHPTYPIRDDQGRLLGVVTRHDTDPKYRYPQGVSTSRTLYGSLRPCKVLVAVEGASDVMALQAGGLPRGWAVVGTYGAGFHHPQYELVARMNPKTVIAAFDNDDAGRRANQRAEEQLTDLGYTVVSDPWSSLGVKDAGECPPRQRTRALTSLLERNGHR